MITLNNKKFAENKEEFMDSLFQAGGTCVGFAKRNKRSIKLFDHNHELIGCINKHKVLHNSTPLHHITHDNIDTGKFWHSYGCPAIISKDSFIRLDDDIERLVKSYSNGACYK